MVLWWWTELLNVWVCVWIRSVIKSKTYKICKMNKNETFNEQCWLFLQRKTAASRSKSTNDAVVPNERRLFAKKKSGRDKSEEGCLRSDTWRRRLQRRKAAMKKRWEWGSGVAGFVSEQKSGPLIFRHFCQVRRLSGSAGTGRYINSTNRKFAHHFR